MNRPNLRHPFEDRLLSIKTRLKPEPFNWYPFDSIANITHLEALLPNGLDTVSELAAGEPIADIGSGDGDMAFLLESLGHNVTAIDWPGYNANGMLGLALLRQELQSSIAIRELEIDQQFSLDGERFGLVFGLGLLYHLKNPYYFLEKLALHARYGIFSTAILPRSKSSDPIAWLAAESEFHNDPTNFWFFSENGVLRLLDRCGWDVRATRLTGDAKDTRFFCLTESRIAQNKPTIRILNGWHEIENFAWRWTGREFGVMIETPAPATCLEFRFEIKSTLLKLSDKLTLEASINGVPLPAATYSTPGKHLYSQSIPPNTRKAEIQFRLSHTFLESGEGGRDLGVIVRLPRETVIDEDCGLQLG